jgi:hypothetical protein
MYLRRIKSTYNGDDLEVKLSVSKVNYRYFDDSCCLLSSSSHSVFLDDISSFCRLHVVKYPLLGQDQTCLQVLLASGS